MRRSAQRVRIAGEILCNSIARLTDVAPTYMVVLTEETDWLLVGGDLRAAIDTVKQDPEVRAALEDDELVEA